MSRQIGHSLVLKEYRDMSKSEVTVFVFKSSSRIIIVVIKSAFIYHLCFVVLSILHHRDNERRTEKGEKKMTHITLLVLL